ncbi:MAG: hypothetical protein KAQ66_10530, partial [Rhodospirillaceae bacterium]|nr:hypothetical protein [Rhodospirillaceae bacterium]
MDAYLDPANIEETILTLLAWLKGEVFVVSTLAQLIIVVLAYLPARFISSPLENALEKAISATWADKIRAKLRQILRPMVQ